MFYVKGYTPNMEGGGYNTLKQDIITLHFIKTIFRNLIIKTVHLLYKLRSAIQLI